jgi:hypothetical protein
LAEAAPRQEAGDSIDGGIGGEIVEIEPHSRAALELDTELHGDKAVELELGKRNIGLGQLAGDGLAIEHAGREVQGRDKLSASSKVMAAPRAGAGTKRRWRLRYALGLAPQRAKRGTLLAGAGQWRAMQPPGHT